MIRLFSRISLVCIVVVSLSGLAVAHERDQRDSRGAAQFGYQNGYVDGFQRGREDLQAGVGYSYVSRDYDNALRGYESYMGRRERYEDGYRNGYREGYDDGFHNRRAQHEEAYNDSHSPRYQGDDHSEGAYGQRSVAFRVGYQDGLIAGEKDHRHNKNFRPSKHDRYEDADHGYRHEHGSKKEYKSGYREGYLARYQRGYNAFQGAGNRWEIKGRAGRKT